MTFMHAGCALGFTLEVMTDPQAEYAKLAMSHACAYCGLCAGVSSLQVAEDAHERDTFNKRFAHKFFRDQNAAEFIL